MKYSAIALSALATAAAAQPVLLNSAYEVKEGTPFELKYSGCEDGCTIVLQTGEPTHLTDVTPITSSATGTSYSWTPSGLPSGTYSFKITNNGDKSENYSVRFEYSGTGTLTSSASSASATSSATGSTSRSSSASASSSTSATGSSSASSVTSRSTTTPATSATSSVSVSVSRNATITTLTTASSKPAELTSTKKSEEPAKTTAAATTAATTVPNSGATRLGSSLALVAGAVMAMVYLN